MIPARQRRVDAAPAHQLRAPGDVGILAVDEEIGIEELAQDRNVFDHLAAVERRGGRSAEDVFEVQVVAVVHFLAAPVQVAQHRREVDSGRIDQRFFGKIEGGADGEQLAAHRADLRIDLAGIDQSLNEVRQQQHVRIQRQDPLGLGKSDRLILRRGEADVLVVIKDAAAIGEGLENIDGPVGGGVVDHDHVQVRVLLIEHRLQAALDEPAAVVGHYRDGN